MKKLTIVIAALLLLIITGCNTTPPGARVDRTNLTKGLNFKQVRFKFIEAYYNKKLKEQQIYWQWLQDNHERVNPFLDLNKWRKQVAKQYVKDEKTIKKIDADVDNMICYDMIHNLTTLFGIWWRSHSEEAFTIRLKIAKRMNKTNCRAMGWKGKVPLYPKNSYEWMANP